jgi:hypothetical protein
MGGDEVGFVTKRRARTNAEALEVVLRRLRREGRMDPMAEVVATLAGTSARLVDLVTSDDPLNDTPVYARAACLRVHAGVLVELRTLTPPIKPPDAYDEIAAALAETYRPTTVAESDDSASEWDRIEAQMDACPGTWPEEDPEPEAPNRVW